MNEVILVAVNDSPASFDAAVTAVDCARLRGARLHAVMVIEAGALDRHQDANSTLSRRRDLAADAVLNHVAALGREAGVDVVGHRRTGRVAAEIINEAREVGATMIVMARVDRPGHAIPSIGGHTLRVLEFSAVPVLVVPPA